MMLMKKYILYTSSSSKWYKEQADLFAAEISKTPGRGEVKIDVVRKIMRNPVIITDSDGDRRPSWSWLERYFPIGDYDGLIIHFTPYYRSKFGIKRTLGGSRRSKEKLRPYFWVCADQGRAPRGYPKTLSNFLRIMFHEQAHFDEDVDNQVGNVLTQDSVHTMDYKMKKIHLYHYLVDYRGQAIKEAVDKLLVQIIKLARKVL
jgi:hypothetical protein